MSEALDSGFEVEYWDISKLFFVSNYGQEDSSHLLPTKNLKITMNLNRLYVF